MRRHPWLTTILVFAVLCAVVFFCLEWRAEMRWQRYAAEARARGVKLLLTDFARPEIPDEQNFAALPMMRKAFTGDPESEPFQLPLIAPPKFGPARNSLPPNGGRPPTFGDPIKGQEIDWVEWQAYFHSVGYLTETSDNSTGDVVRALDHYAPEFQQWSQWGTRPQCRFPLALTKGTAMPIGHLAAFQSAIKVFVLRMRAHLALNDSTAAYVDFQEGLQAYRLLRKEPSLISGLVRIAVLHVLVAGVGDGCKAHAWDDANLRKIGIDLAAIRAWDDWRLALITERGGLNTTLESWVNAPMRERGKLIAGSVQTIPSFRPSDTQVLVFSLIPRGMIRDNQLRQNQFLDELLARIDTANQTVDLDRETPSSFENIAGTYEQIHYILGRMSGAVYSQIERRYVAVQTELDQAGLACALERFRAKHGTYPEKLDKLTPEFIAKIPTDIYARAPYRYQRIGEATFRLYGVGENRTDDGGQLAPGVPERKQLDAIWLYAPPVR